MPGSTTASSHLTRRVYAVPSNPEFLKEGAAIDDFMYPDRVVVGAFANRKLENCYASLYSPFLAPANPSS
jgi:UDPglucose 6-dehydrogenase